MTNRTYITTSIPYVNAEPHIGHALEYVHTDVLARTKRKLGSDVRLQTGTDDHALKNVRSAEAAGRAVGDHVRTNGDKFLELAALLDVDVADVIRTSTDGRHRPGVEKLWRTCLATGDLYEKEYAGLYCVGCEEFYDPTELDGGVCPDHRTAVEPVTERNWFFRLSAYETALTDAIRSGTLRIEPPAAQREVLAFIGRGLRDFSVSRNAQRARGWGIPVPGDADQVISVWFDALANYITALDYGFAGPSLDHWWTHAERIHVIGKDIVRFHAVYWPGILLSAGVALPSALYVHGFLTVEGTKIGKSLGNAVDPSALVRRYGVDAVRWWLASELPLAADADFTLDRLLETANRDLANATGNLVSRIAALRSGDARDVEVDVTAEPSQLAAGLPARVGAAVARCDLRDASRAVIAVVAGTNRYLEDNQPWRPDAPNAATVVATAHAATAVAVEWIAPFVPSFAARAAAVLRGNARGPAFARLVR